jgi:hypothetical protein
MYELPESQNFKLDTRKINSRLQERNVVALKISSIHKT